MKIGYSDHTVGITSSLIAIMQGAEIIEKHFTNRIEDRMDHVHSADGEELKKLCEFAENSKKIFGKNNFFNFRKDLKNRNNFRRGLYVKKDLKKNTILNIENINFVRPNFSQKLKLSSKIFNYKLNKNVKKDKVITKKDINSI